MLFRKSVCAVTFHFERYTLKQFFLNHLKNLPGWRTKRKLVVFSVDDYGNVRLDSRQARENLDQAGLKIHSRFDAYDALETRADLEALYEVLTSVKDQHGRPAVFTPFALPCNINFERMAEENYATYHYEVLPATYAKLSARDQQAYEGTWALWQEGISLRLMAPQFHGREHLNLKFFEEKLTHRDTEVLTALQNRSYTSLSGSDSPTVGWTAAFSFSKLNETAAFAPILKEGVEAFASVYSYRPSVFTPPAQQFPPHLEPLLPSLGLIHLDKPFYRARHLGSGKFRREFNFSGKNRRTGGTTLVRNVVFEPTDPRSSDWVAYALKQIETAFFWNRPAIISSHRVNFCGHIDEQNRTKGLTALQALLQRIVQRWPEVEFLSAAELGELVAGH